MQCSVCGAKALSCLGDKDFAYSCNDHFQGASQFRFEDASVAYHRCEGCRFTFTASFDHWAPADFKAHIYNEAYLLADPLFPHERPWRNSQMVSALWNRALADTVALDYGGGDGSFARMLNEMGHRCHSVDAFHGGHEIEPGATYDLVTCFEVIEHVPHRDLDAWFATLVGHLSPHGTLLMSTELIDDNPELGNWYIAPRNGHISLHSAHSLRTLAARHGLSLFSINHEMHVMRRG